MLSITRMDVEPLHCKQFIISTKTKGGMRDISLKIHKDLGRKTAITKVIAREMKY